MKILRVELTDWGPHAHLDVDMDAGVFGIVGANGKGKTCFLQAIDFAFTKNLNGRKKESYIRNYGAPDGASKAVDKVWFEKDGKKGHISRTINPSGIKGKLEWDGEVYTKDADIAERMTEIMGVDKAALTNAIFTKQGCLADLITGTPGERQAIFFKLLNLGFLDPRAADLAKKIDHVKEGVVDYGPALDETNASIAEYEAQIEDLTKGLEATQDPSPLIRFLDELGASLYELRQTDALLDNWIGNKRQSQAKVNAVLGLMGCSSVEQMQQKAVELREHLRKNQEYLDDIDREVRDYHTWRRWTEVRNDCASKLRDVAERKKDFGDLVEMRGQAEQLAVQITKAEFLEGIKIRYNAANEAVQSAESELEACRSLETEAENARKVLEAVRTQLSINEESLKTMVRMADMYNDDGSLKFADGICPTCGQTVPAASVEQVRTMQEAAASMKLRVEELKGLIRSQEASIDAKYDQPVRNATAKLAAAVQRLEEHKKQKELLSEEAPAQTAQQLRDRRKELLDEIGKAEQLERDENLWRTKTAEANAALEPFGGEEPPCGDPEIVAEVARGLEREKEELRQYEEKLKEAEMHQDKVEYADRAIEQLNRKRETQAEGIEQDISKAPAALDDVDMYDISSIKQHIEALQEVRARHMSLRTSLASAQQALETKKKRAKDIRDLIGKNAKKIELIRELGEARSMILKTGLPTLYMEDVFKKMIASVNKLLVQMQANFSVTKDPDVPLTFKFIRTDEPTGHEFPQEALSGGQAIRLALSLLLTVQRMLLPDVGLLVLDEPSSHIDADGVNSMASMFRRLGQLWANTDTQLIVVDHNPSLISAFDKSIRLGDAN